MHNEACKAESCVCVSAPQPQSCRQEMDAISLLSTVSIKGDGGGDCFLQLHKAVLLPQRELVQICVFLGGRVRSESKYMRIRGHMGGNCIIVHTWSSEIKDWTETLKQTKSLHH